jgi:hypothetical protein
MYLEWSGKAVLTDLLSQARGEMWTSGGNRRAVHAFIDAYGFDRGRRFISKSCAACVAIALHSAFVRQILFENLDPVWVSVRQMGFSG